MPFKTYDWLRMPNVRALPPDVRGLLVDMLCYMWEGVERGVMDKPNGEIYTREEIVRLVGVDGSGSDAWLDSLVDRGLLAIRDDGAYFSRRMVRGEAIRAVRRLAGIKGGNATKAKASAVPPAPAVAPPPDPEQADLFPPEAPPPQTPEQKAAAEKKKKYKYAEYVTLTRDEYAKLCDEYGEEPAKAMIDILNNYKGSRGRKYKSDYLTIRGWVKDKYFESLQKYGDQRTTYNRGSGTENNKAVPGQPLQTDKGTGVSGDTETSKNYSERF